MTQFRRDSILQIDHVDLLHCQLIILCSDPALDTRPNPYSSHRTRLAYHTFSLARSTPVRALLAVSGESWLVTEKIVDAVEFATARAEVRSWALNSTCNESDDTFELTTSAPRAVDTAVAHAWEILRLVANDSKNNVNTDWQSDGASRGWSTGLLFAPWALHLASLVLWARSYAANNLSHIPLKYAAHQATGGVSATRQPLRRAELDYTFRQLLEQVENGSGAVALSLVEVVLRWTAARIRKSGSYGLAKVATDVLGKLAERGDEEGWF